MEAGSGAPDPFPRSCMALRLALHLGATLHLIAPIASVASYCGLDVSDAASVAAPLGAPGALGAARSNGNRRIRETRRNGRNRVQEGATRRNRCNKPGCSEKPWVH